MTTVSEHAATVYCFYPCSTTVAALNDTTSQANGGALAAGRIGSDIVAHASEEVGGKCGEAPVLQEGGEAGKAINEQHEKKRTSFGFSMSVEWYLEDGEEEELTPATVLVLV